MTEEGNGFFPVQAAARLTGLTPDTLRAWERRYRAVTPRRVGRGRAYSRDDIARLRLLRSAVQHGHAIGAVARLPNDAVEALLHADAAPPPAEKPAALTDALVAAIRDYDVPRAEREFGRLAATLNPPALVLDVVLPVLRLIGDEWQHGQFRAGQEHLMSGIIRHVLGGLLRVLGGSLHERTVLFATPPGERHEFGILSAALLTASSGVGVIYLGADLPVEEIAEAAERARATVVVVGLTALPRAEARNHLAELRRRLPESIALWAGGPAAPHVRGVHLTGSLEQFARDLAAQAPGARVARA
jgi:DNA-binding transcriptional MerR regulator/methylmalonyl-CoA mutase cobalamin-binding subunit